MKKPSQAILATMLLLCSELISASPGHREAGDLAWKISTGRGDMPPLKETLNDNAIWHLVNYLQQGFP